MSSSSGAHGNRRLLSEAQRAQLRSFQSSSASVSPAQINRHAEEESDQSDQSEFGENEVDQNGNLANFVEPSTSEDSDASGAVVTSVSQEGSREAIRTNTDADNDEDNDSEFFRSSFKPIYSSLTHSSQGGLPFYPDTEFSRRTKNKSGTYRKWERGPRGGWRMVNRRELAGAFRNGKTRGLVKEDVASDGDTDYEDLDGFVIPDDEVENEESDTRQARGKRKHHLQSDEEDSVGAYTAYKKPKQRTLQSRRGDRTSQNGVTTEHHASNGPRKAYAGHGRSRVTGQSSGESSFLNEVAEVGDYDEIEQLRDGVEHTSAEDTPTCGDNRRSSRQSPSNRSFMNAYEVLRQSDKRIVIAESDKDTMVADGNHSTQPSSADDSDEALLHKRSMPSTRRRLVPLSQHSSRSAGSANVSPPSGSNYIGAWPTPPPSAGPALINMVGNGNHSVRSHGTLPATVVDNDKDEEELRESPSRGRRRLVPLSKSSQQRAIS
ncbi:hypothetical protein HDU93_005870 [Gonapodya sp. JEL0774]|nr:hypothetical protein HDU93_005870 [Gonapodya sp. JEL0774]